MLQRFTLCMFAIFVVFAAIALLVGCDACSAAAKIHLRRCADGDDRSCAWVVDHGVTAAGTCSP